MVTLDFSSALNVFDPSGTTVLVTGRPTASTPITVPGDGTAVTFNVSGTSLMASAVLTNPALFAPFEGTGTFNLPVTGAITVGFTPGLIPPFSVLDATGSVSGTLEVLYTSVPEPSTATSILLAGLVLAAAYLLHRRRSPSSIS
jgi:MYXO-CTERM domain-containing protein